MSESMAFIGGVAVAGLAALLLLKGTNTPIQTNFPIPPQITSTGVTPQIWQPPIYQQPNPGLTNPNSPNQPSAAANPDQRLEMEKLNMQIEKLKGDNEQLRFQNQQLQGQVQNFTQQQWQLAQQQQQQRMVAFQQQQQPQNPWWSSPIVWAVGGMSLTIGGGIVVAGVLALFGPRQRPARTVQVIHPYNSSVPPLAPIRRAEFLPSRIESRRVGAPEYDEMH
ncbi:heterocyst differentiation related protein [Richelia sinica FACHB-800]|uniref:Heterocyst differentiation related protein n=1 Tax=Richelia sinica FACHB-800 TaxID=1357546 RepID=A0A975Y4G4_9NOST|nr:heterocyst differentiation related protein [Richelia sinica]MBD2664735.1 heterocyst differentiation related protein [Richelia sinica FACHB-800]QXE23161.1 heterocyst differentiation related protein [Richelia sinica FACHB-800]